MFNDDEMKTMIDAYQVCALWSSSGRPVGTEDETITPVPLDDIADIDDIADETAASMRYDCYRFASLPQVVEVIGAHMDAKPWDNREFAGQLGHDLWLTRNGHGAGFWDRPDRDGFTQAYRDLADLVGYDTEFLPVDLYIGDDGKVYA